MRAADGASAPDGPGLDERTAFLVGAHTLKLGILAFDYGFSDTVSVGSDPPFWLARTTLPVLIPNLHVKELIFQREPVTISAEVGGYVADLQSNNNASGWLIAAPLAVCLVRARPQDLAARRGDLRIRTCLRGG